MPGKPSYEELVRRLEALEKAVQPQTMAQSLERTWAPRGGEPRIIDSAGKTLDYVPAVQLKGGTSILDVAKQRVVYTPASQPASKIFSQDASTSDDTALNWYASDGSGVKRAAIRSKSEDVSNPTNPQDRLLLFELARDLTEASPRVDMVWHTGTDDTSSLGRTSATLTALGQGTDKARLDLSTPKGASTTTVGTGVLSVLRSTGTARASISGARGTTVARFNAEYSHFDGAQVTYNLPDTPNIRVLHRASDGASQFMQVSGDTNNDLPPGGTPIQRVTRGPFTVAVTALAAGATTSATLTTARKGTGYVVVGGPNGAAGTEQLAWSWVDSGTNDVTVTIRNTSAGALTATMRFYVIATS